MFDITAQDIQLYLIMAPGLLVALVCHEVAHGYVAFLLGDPTAKSQGRLTLNPLKHLDPIGTLAFFFVQFGWARPVPVNARYFRNPRQGMMYTAMAGPGANFALAALFALAFHMMSAFGVSGRSSLYAMTYYGVFINLILAAFNLLPIPPLDGSNVLAYFLPPKAAFKFMSLSRYGFVILIGIILLGRFTGFNLVGQIILPIVRGLASVLGVPV
ncbi:MULTISPECIES: site-2 protease family protein [unclassified Pseudodesulfovibrio]|uniref:site-2 protease family protein n=1 Tax=unclassified Pseudodesulfovibrio TaxID=2661612 RepID=UPI000FEB9DEA|nr:MULTISPECIES: site-2 protease family protein [unclassified Pseudodesulfovibrio]MCJ2166092.1 site-2 protease family protein [Pseudodesulfovibrio sp. S3-i]RWU02444.1 site-2 protease family protein [Pseudodesulfovibrio sp. S3]